ncbi:MAG: hypothetical protein AcusKO_35160 [Acuticoccus sp.]
MRALALFAFWLLAGPALAFEPTGNAIADRFLTAVERAGFADAAVEGVGREGNATVLTGLTAGSDTGKALAIAAVRLVTPLVNGDNELIADEIVYEGVAMREGGAPTTAIGRVELSAVRFQGDASGGDATDLLGDFARLRIADIMARSKAGEEITLGALDLEVTSRERPGVLAGAISLTDLGFALSLLDPAAAGELRAMGYGALVVDIAVAGEWEAASGRADLAAVRLGIDGMGTLSLSTRLSGLTAETYGILRSGGFELPKLLSALNTVSLGALEVSLEDGGLTERLLTRLSTASGSDRASVATGLLEALAVPLANLGDPDFAQAALQAASSFLDTPGRLTLSAAPASEVTAMQITSAALLNPRLIPSLLELKISSQ